MNKKLKKCNTWGLLILQKTYYAFGWNENYYSRQKLIRNDLHCFKPSMISNKKYLNVNILNIHTFVIIAFLSKLPYFILSTFFYLYKITFNLHVKCFTLSNITLTFSLQVKTWFVSHINIKCTISSDTKFLWLIVCCHIFRFLAKKNELL